jgi:hypothetical protein
MTKKIKMGLLTVMVAAVSACGGGGGDTPVLTSAASPAAVTTVRGLVADGYLQGAEIFLDKNGNYQWDETEPKTMTGPGGAYAMTIDPNDLGKFPMVVRVIPDVTIDEDNPGQKVHNGYVMSAPAGMTDFISPMSSMIRQKMENGHMTMQQAADDMRKQLNFNGNVNMLGNYMSQSPTDVQFQQMQAMARYMASLTGNFMGMGAGSAVNADRYRTMMGLINQVLPQMMADVLKGTSMQAVMQKYDFNSTLSGMNGNMTGQNMTSLYNPPASGTYWGMNGGHMTPNNGGSSGGTTSSGGGMSGGGGMM